MDLYPENYEQEFESKLEAGDYAASTKKNYKSQFRQIKKHFPDLSVLHSNPEGVIDKLKSLDLKTETVRKLN
jgi:hypothetical protein